MSADSLPRPRTAWLMALCASATLWVTGELALWMMPAQLLAYAYAYATRSCPPAFRKSPIWLNIGMFCISAITISKALEGCPATLSLAYFAGLAQALQLLDARPRKSEFLLVALALFQVLLAANLTDSVFFPVLLLLFLVCTTFTLLLHTLRTEALAAGERPPNEGILGVRLLHTTLLSCGLTIFIGLVLFALLPRLHANLLRGAVRSGFSIAGFSDRVSLGSIGRIRHHEGVVLRVETLRGHAPAPADAYWRGLAFDQFDGRSWSVSVAPGQSTRIRLNGLPRFGVDLGDGPGPGALVQRIVREPVAAGVLFSAGPARRLEGPLDQLQLDGNGGLHAPSRTNERVRYTVWTPAPGIDEAALRADHAALPREHGPVARSRAQRYLDLPSLDTRIPALARRVTGGLQHDSERARAIEQYLRVNGHYTDSPPDMKTSSGRSPIEGFLLGELAGHCEYFASAMVVLARSIGLPARLVNGFAGGRVNRIGGFSELSRSDAHAWVEIRYERAGWVRYDPTPPDLRLRAAGLDGLGSRLADLASALELWWFQRVVDFDSADQIAALRATWNWFERLRSSSLAGPTRIGPPAPGRPNAFGTAPRVPFPAWVIALPVAAALLLALALRRRPRNAAPAFYTRALRLLGARGFARSPSTPARDFARRIESALPAPAARSFERITERYLSERFSNPGEPNATASANASIDAEVDSLRRHLRGLPRRRMHPIFDERPVLNERPILNERHRRDASAE